MSQEYILLIAILGLSIVGHNMTVAYAAGIVLILKVLGLTQVLNTLGTNGISWGIIILTVAILIPIANGTINWQHIINCFKSPIGIVALAVGVLVAVAGHFGVGYMQATPEIVTALIIGTMAGVFFFNGVAVGPLIAAGIVCWLVELVKMVR